MKTKQVVYLIVVAIILLVSISNSDTRNHVFSVGSSGTSTALQIYAQEMK